MIPETGVPLEGVSATWSAVVRTMQALAAVACFTIAVEQDAMWRRGLLNSVWRADVLTSWWGWRRRFMTSGVLRQLPWVQMMLAATLLLNAALPDHLPYSGSLSATMLAISLWLTALRFRGTVNGGSDGMLFTVLVGLAVATSPLASPRLAYGAVLFVAAQVVLSYFRAGLVKARQPAWWTGEALRSFLAIPAYSVPTWVPQMPLLLRTLSVAVILFELAAPLALFSTTACLLYSAVAWCFHLATALIFGLNRFLLVWTAALPSVWFAAYLIQS
jgi:hypothetical protein